MISDLQMIIVGITHCPGIGKKTFYELMKKLTENDLSLLDVWEGNVESLRKLSFSDRMVNIFLEHRKNFPLKKKQKELQSKDIQVVTFLDKTYPELLLSIPDFPPVLFVIGKLISKCPLPIAVVGTRKMTSYGKMVTGLLTKDLVRSGAQIISGFMYGVDTFAHESAVEIGGYTVGVLGYGFDHLYPNTKHQRALKERIIRSGGGFISEYLPETPPNPGRFPERNRIVAGLSKGVLVTEAASKSGSKITANLATEYGRDVFAVPGPITSPYSEGTKDLINQGAKLVASAQDILDEYQVSFRSLQSDNNSIEPLENETEKRVVALLLQQTLESNEIGRELKIEPSQLLTTLTMLELKGIVIKDRAKYTLRI